ncbi:hypothetical protein [Streptomyces sp. NPDC048142]|uniref:P-type ATPase n=1 Tax=Streptomyces sp. NPDC048142 TaxID=3365501 RepID=UPI003714684B
MPAERRAERSLEALCRMLVPTDRVRRDGEAQVVPAGFLVRGDTVLLEAGDRVPDDGRPAIAEEHVPVAERTGMLFMNTALTRGRAEMIVTATGMRTEVGAIAEALRTGAEPSSPLQVQMDILGRSLAVSAAWPWPPTPSWPSYGAKSSPTSPFGRWP